MIITVYQNEVKLDTYNLGDLVSSNYVENFTFLIGRSSECRIILEDKKVSRNHCEVSFRGGKWILSRISKFSEVMLSGESIDEIELKESMNINISSYVLSFDLPLSEKNEASNHANLSCEDLSAPSEQELTPPDGSPGGEDEETHLQLNEEVETLDSLDDNDENNLSEDDSYPDETDVDNEGYDNNENDYDSNDSDENNFDLEEDGEDGQNEMEESVGEKTQVFTGFADYDLEIFGEFAPYDRFSIGEGECVIGREENSVDIFLHDSEVSSKHAKIIKTKVSLRIVDLNSANGTLLNGSRINESDLQSGDEFIIGSTTFTVHIRSDMIMNEKDRLLPVEDNQVVEVEEVIEVDEEQTEMEEVQEEAPKSLIGKFKKLPPKKQKIYGAVALLLIFLLLDSEEPDKAIAPNKKPNASKAVGKNGEKPGSKKTIENSLDKLTIQEREVVASKYQLAFEFIQQGKYSESLAELDYVMKLSPDYKQARSLYQMSREGLAKLEELEKKRVAEIEAKKRQDKIDKLLEKATKYVKERQAQAADGMFSKILELDPENFDVPQLKLEIDAWKKEQERIAMEKAQKDADRKRKLSQISTSRTFFGKEEWYKAILKVEEFLRIKSMDEDLVKEATEMLKTSKANLKNKISPMVGKARSLKEGQDLKAAYEQYLDVLIHEPTNVEALDELNEIRDILTMRSQRVYRDGLISESLMLFKEAKEKFQEVQQISPSDSDYYKKASLKLREYLE